MQPKKSTQIRRRPASVFLQCLGIAFVLNLSGCNALIGGAVSGLADNLTKAILNNPDIDTVKEGVPAYLLMVDALVLTTPNNVDVLLSAATLYGAYAGGFVTDPSRASQLTTKALDYALAALCRKDKAACDVRTLPFDQLQAWTETASIKNADLLYAVAVAWAGWVQAHSSDWNALAELARVKLLMSRVLALDETLDNGGPHLYHGVFETLLPPALGGRPELAKVHFDKAIALSEGRFLMAKVIYARQYARLLYDRGLHDRLLNEVLAADPVAPGITVVNKLAQQQAKILLEEADDYF